MKMEARPEAAIHYYDYLKKVLKKPEEYEIIGPEGEGYTRVDALDKVTGNGKYTDDIYLPNMLYAKFKRSPYAHAKIISIDTSKAEALEGVKAVITAKDFTAVSGMGTYTELDNAMASEDFADKKPLCIDKVAQVGDEVACVAATTEAIAEKAVELIEVEYEELTPIFDMHEALKPDAVRIHNSNISTVHRYKDGDPEKAFAEADFTDHERYTTQPIYHCAMEPHGTVADWDGEVVTVWDTTQNFFTPRHWIAQNLGIPVDKVNMKKPYVGGGFGGKVDTYPNEICAAKLAMITGRPVKLILSRAESFWATKSRHAFDFVLESAYNKDGMLLANKVRSVSNGGSYGGSGLATAFLSNMFATLPYKCDNVDLEAIRATTNTPGGGAMRGYSGAQVHFAHESHMMDIARNLGMDPLEFRKKNAITRGYETPFGMKCDSCAFVECLDEAADQIGYATRDELPKGKGIGIAGSGFCTGEGHPQIDSPAWNTCTILVRLSNEGYVTVYAGTNEIGQGSRTMVSAVIAEELGLRISDIRYTDTDTTTGFFDSGAFGSRVTMYAGNAARRAAGDAKLKLYEFWAEQWGVDIEDIKMKDHRLFVPGDDEKNMSFEDAVFYHEQEHLGQQILGEGTYAHDAAEEFFSTEHGNQSPAYSFSACGADIDVDMETGLIDMNRFIYAHDCGYPLNIRACEGQIEGSVQLSIGYTLFEEPILNDKGKMINDSFRDYRFPTALDMPYNEGMKSVFVCDLDPYGPFGAKEVGEGSTSPVAPAISDALYQATGLNFHDLPLTPEKVWKALKEKEAKGLDTMVVTIGDREA